MAYGSISDPVGGTVITVAYAVANMLDPIRWLRLMTGNADPPGSAYVVVSTSTTGTQWMKIPADALASGAVVAHLGYVPVNQAGDSLTGDLKFALGKGIVLDTSGSPGRLFDTSGFTALLARNDIARIYTAAASVVMLELQPLVAVFNGQLQAPSASITGAIAAASGGVAGLWSAANVAVAGLCQGSRLEATVTTGTAPLVIASTTKVANLNVDKVDGADASTTPGAGVIPIADGSGQIASGFIPASVGAPLVGEIRLYGVGTLTSANAAGWLLCDGSAVNRTTHAALFAVLGGTFGTGDGSSTFNLPDLRDRVAIGKSGSKALGSTGGAATVDLTHAHSGASLGISGSTGGPSATDGLGNNGGTTTPTAAHTHGAGTLDVTGNTDNQAGQSAVSILPPYQALNYIIYSGVAT